MKSDIKILKEIIRNILKEMTGTSAVAGYSTPFAFSSKKGINRPTKTLKKMGFKVVGENELEDKINENVSVDVSKEMSDFKRKLATSEITLAQSLSDTLKKKFLGKQIKIHGSKGYGQFKTDYTLSVYDVKVEDWYSKEDYQLIITGNDRKQYFIDINVPIVIVSDKGNSTVQPSTSVKPVADNPPTIKTSDSTAKSPSPTIIVPKPTGELDSQLSK